jgi:outer membrane protein assembly factor BamA
LVGFLPNSAAVLGSKKMLVTGEANILLHNSLGSGETIGLNWQQLQQKSPSLNIIYAHPYIFHSPVGLRFVFDMFRKDSTFLNINMNIGATYKVGDLQEATVFLQKLGTIVNGVDTNYILQTRHLPQAVDVSSVNLGTTYTYNNTDYRYNPRKGNELSITVAAGTKQIKKNNQVVELKDSHDPSFNFSSLYDTVKLNTYQFRAIATAAHYFPLSKQSAIKTAINAGGLQSGNYFINELFRIGGYRLLRGFDEESQYVSHYAVGTAEIKYLIGQNSSFYAFLDGGWARHPLAVQTTHTYLGTGVGLAFETKAGIFNLVWAVGKRDDTNLNLRQSKVHLGFVNYF